MKFTYQELKAINATGKIKMIYYSTGSRWWTHDPEDVTDAREPGYKAQDESMQRLLSNPEVPDAKKEHIRALLKLIQENGRHIPVDPAGFGLYQMENADRWINEAAKKPEFFGKHGIDAFMAAHHKNCEGNAFKTWDDVNAWLDSKLDQDEKMG